MENVITLGKVIGLSYLFCLPLPPPLYFVLQNFKNKRNDLARPVMGTIFLVIVFCTFKFSSLTLSLSPSCALDIVL